MKALQLQESGELLLTDVEQPKAGKGQALVKIMATALNKRDQFIWEGKYPNIHLPCILGSDGAGVVEKIGSGVSEQWLGKKVVINPNLLWGNNPDVQAREYTILGMPSNGALAEYIVVNEDRLHPSPEHLTLEEAAALPLGGLTAFRACFHHGEITAGENVLISGFGGGVAQFAFQFAQAAGADIYVTSGDAQKRERAKEMGAVGAFDYNKKDWYKNVWKTRGGFDVIIDSAGGDQINHFIKVMRPAGRIVFYGATNGLPGSLDLYRMFWNQITLQGSTMGNDQEFVEMLQLVNDHKIKPMLDSVRDFDEAIEAMQDLKANKKSGKIVLKL